MSLERKIVIGITLFAMSGLIPSAVHAGDRNLRVVASSTFFASLVEEIAGNHMEVNAIAGPRFNVHFYQPTPKDIRTVRKADLYVHWGLDLEAWSDPLLEASGKPELFRGRERNLDLSQGIELLNVPVGPLSRSQGDVHLFGNPHYHLDPRNMKIMVRSIAKKLQELDTTNADVYRENLEAFLSRLDHKLTEWKDRCSHCRGKELIAYHDDMGYLTSFLGIELEHFIEPKPGIPPTPQHLEFLERYAEENDVKAITLSSYFASDSSEKLAERIGSRVVIIAHNAGEIKGTENVFDFFDYNVQVLGEVLK